MMRLIPKNLMMLWVLAVLCCLPTTAWAETFAVVTAIAEPDARGRWRPVQTTPAAAKLEGETRTPLVVGMALDLGEQVVTDEARVTIRLGKREHITVSPAAAITIQERSVIQRMGEVYYQVRDIFSVQYGTVQTAVEGTEFAISGSESGVGVAVTDGVVRVSNAGASVRVKRGQQVMVAPTLVPAVPTKLPLSAAQSARSGAWSLGRPRLQVGALAGGGLMGDEGGVRTSTFAALRVLSFFNVVADGGMSFSPSSHRSDSGLGLEFVLGGLSIGGSGTATIERWNKACGGRYAALHLGGSVHGRYTLDITRRFFVAAQAKAGGNGDGINATFGLGGGVSL
jgi:hypothetical protein